MKKTMITVLGLIVGLHCLIAQTSKGTFMGGASTSIEMVSFNSNDSYPLAGIGFSTIKSKSDDPTYEGPETKQRAVNIKPRVGYFILNNVALGMDFQWSQFYEEGETIITVNGNVTEAFESSITINTALTGPFLRFYYPMNKFYLYAEPSIRFGQIKSTLKGGFDPDDESVNKTNLLRASGAIGAAFPLSNRFTFDVQTAYDYLRVMDSEDNPNNVRTVITGFSLQLGFTLLLHDND